MQTHSPEFAHPRGSAQGTTAGAQGAAHRLPAGELQKKEVSAHCQGTATWVRMGARKHTEFTHTDQMPKPVGMGPAKQDVNITKHRPASEPSAPVTTQRQTQQPALRANTQHQREQ